jgi:hypothetical protein
MTFPLTIATCPFRIPNSNQQPFIEYGMKFYELISIINSCDAITGYLFAKVNER